MQSYVVYSLPELYSILLSVYINHKTLLTLSSHHDLCYSGRVMLMRHVYHSAFFFFFFFFFFLVIALKINERIELI